jgi:hypothetical protein
MLTSSDASTGLIATGPITALISDSSRAAGSRLDGGTGAWTGFAIKPRTQPLRSLRACLSSDSGSRGFGALPLKNHAAPDLAAPHDLVLRRVVRLHRRVVHRLAHAHVADRRRALVGNLDLCRREIGRDRRIRLDHHRAEHQQERGGRDAAVLDDGVEAVEDMNRLAGRRQRHGGRRVGRQARRSHLLGIEHPVCGPAVARAVRTRPIVGG